MKSWRLLLGMGLAGVAWVLLLGYLVTRGRPLPWFMLSYNMPITMAFSGLVVHDALAMYAAGGRRGLTLYGPIGAVWCLGGVLLFLRLVTKSIDVSGHMSWAILMATQSWVEDLPTWFRAVMVLIGVHVLLLKLFVLGGHSGQNGVMAGGVLAGLLWMATRMGKRHLER